jgi:hypothetical protein
LIIESVIRVTDSTEEEIDSVAVTLGMGLDECVLDPEIDDGIEMVRLVSGGNARAKLDDSMTDDLIPRLEELAKNLEVVRERVRRRVDVSV